MKSLNKAFDIMEFVLNQDGEPATPGVIATASGLNTATCVRILETLVNRGYIEKVSRRLGYVAGPALFGLSMRECPYSRLSEASESPLRELAELTSSMVNISVMQAGRRYILNYYSAVSGKMPVPGTVHYSDHYTTATGRLLLSVASSAKLDEIVNELGLPGDSWPEIASREDLDRALMKISAAGRICYLSAPYWIIGGLTYGEGCPPAAIGFGIDDHRDPTEALEQVDATRKQIEAALKIKREFH